MDRWELTVGVSPHSSGEGAETDLKACGGQQFHTIKVAASDADDALRQAHILRQGIETNPRVWHALVVKIERTT